MSLDLSFNRLSNLLSELSDRLDELTRLRRLSGPDDIQIGSESGLDDVRDTVIKAFNSLKSLDLQLNDHRDTNTVNRFDASLERYTKLVDGLKSFDPLLATYSFVPTFKKEIPVKTVSEEVPQLKRAKSVRFKDNLIEPPSVSLNASTPGPYRDNPLAKPASTVEEEGPRSLSNQQIFIDNQQEMFAQDEILSQLASSISRQNQMGGTIGTELNDHMVILEDLEMMVDHSDRNLRRAKTRLDRFSERLKENGEWTTIFVLIVILLLLLTVLK
ncbi:unnamed protein product [Kuraishia capsulata CBS 1993]|uniref:t-SNARE coiled-coil homology domain-containing protein n=1 Tax=Kuraishia capsulata CBS 1993 TaxID=1382522 RepID=W6MTN7_9ASCO|nr:uncharacterized protein KUCA_T00005827001 [Kuraishia capsulata CBS 1993]CDK29833.1 unnamed protein product [Kuraishia capsulata CBS 1993]